MNTLATRTTSPSPSGTNEFSSSAAIRHRVLVVDDHPLFRSGIAALLEDEPDFEICGEAAESHAAITAFRELQPDIVVMDIGMPGADGIELTKMMLAEKPRTSILIFSGHDEMLYALRALRAGAKGYVQKSDPPKVLLAALHKVMRDEVHVSNRMSERLLFKAIHSPKDDSESPLSTLSDRELEILQWIGKGAGTRSIAEALNLSIKTVETHRAHIKQKLGFKDAGELVHFAKEWHEQNTTQPIAMPAE